MFFVEILYNGDFLPFGCADTLKNAMIMLDGKPGRISTQKAEFLIVSDKA